MAFELYGDSGRAGTVRAELSRLRPILGHRLGSEPYRILGPCDADSPGPGRRPRTPAAQVEGPGDRRAARGRAGRIAPSGTVRANPDVAKSKHLTGHAWRASTERLAWETRVMARRYHRYRATLAVARTVNRLTPRKNRPSFEVTYWERVRPGRTTYLMPKSETMTADGRTNWLTRAARTLSVDEYLQTIEEHERRKASKEMTAAGTAREREQILDAYERRRAPAGAEEARARRAAPGAGAGLPCGRSSLPDGARGAPQGPRRLRPGQGRPAAAVPPHRPPRQRRPLVPDDGPRLGEGRDFVRDAPPVRRGPRRGQRRVLRAPLHRLQVPRLPRRRTESRLSARPGPRRPPLAGARLQEAGEEGHPRLADRCASGISAGTSKRRPTVPRRARPIPAIRRSPTRRCWRSPGHSATRFGMAWRCRCRPPRRADAAAVPAAARRHRRGGRRLYAPGPHRCLCAAEPVGRRAAPRACRATRPTCGQRGTAVPRLRRPARPVRSVRAGPRSRPCPEPGCGTGPPRGRKARLPA
ncbi:hypothetical protein ACU686_05460 [Yinghuangia aomiensis]